VFTRAVFFRVAGPYPAKTREDDMTATSSGPVTISADGTFVHQQAAAPSGRTIIRLQSQLDFAAAPALRERLIKVLHRGSDLLVLDLADVRSCDASGLAVLIGTQRRARLLGIVMRLVAPSPSVAKVLRSTGLDRSFTIYPDLSGALVSERRASARPAPGLRPRLVS
jgi:anti-anti-sigma factor